MYTIASSCFVILSACTQSSTSPEAKLLDILRSLEAAGSARYSKAVFEKREALGTNTVVYVPAAYDLTCGNIDAKIFDVPRARESAIALSSAYGLHMLRDIPVAGSNYGCVLDALDSAKKVGIELREWPYAEPSDSDAYLSNDELRLLELDGYRIYVADAKDYVALADNFTPTLAFLAGLTLFLNDVAEAEDVYVDGLLFSRELTWPLQIVAPNNGMWRQSSSSLIVKKEGVLRLECLGAESFGPPTVRDPMGFSVSSAADSDRKTGSAGGAPSVLILPIGAAVGSVDSPRLVTVFQTQGEEDLKYSCTSFVVFLPSRFDLLRPFHVDISLSPGEYTFGATALVGLGE